MNLIEWVIEENKYVRAKVEVTGRRPADYLSMDPSSAEDNNFWRDICMYVRRATILGLDTAAGRQAIGKGYMVYSAYLEAVTNMYGPMPVGGMPSGVVIEDAAI
jgi:hypothetical protein